MTGGILILGLNGCGKSTLGRALAGALGCAAMDVEDYYFPVPGNYSQSRTKEEVHRLMCLDAEQADAFVLSCVRCDLPDELLDRIRLAVVLRAAPALRAERIRRREEERFGSRVLPGGDMYESQQRFRAFAAARTENLVDCSLGRLHCPVLEADASLKLPQLVQLVVQHTEAL